jgi:hypothetical protein
MDVEANIRRHQEEDAARKRAMQVSRLFSNEYFY